MVFIHRTCNFRFLSDPNGEAGRVPSSRRVVHNQGTLKVASAAGSPFLGSWDGQRGRSLESFLSTSSCLET